MKDVSADMRPIIGKHVNEVRDILTAAFEESAKLLEEQKITNQLANESVDVTLLVGKFLLGIVMFLAKQVKKLKIFLSAWAIKS